MDIARYQNNNRLYLGLSMEDDYFSDITINLPDLLLPADDFVFVSGDLTKEVKDQLKDYGILSEYLYTADYNMGHYDCYSINLEKLKHYDPDGFEKANLKLDKIEDEVCDIKI